jgi:subtilisin family serine protease
MRNTLLLLTLFILGSLGAQSTVSERVAELFLTQSPGETRSVYLFLRNDEAISAVRTQIESQNIGVAQRPAMVRQSLMTRAAQSQAPVLELINNHAQQHNAEVGLEGSYFLMNLIRARVDATLLQQLAAHPAIEYIELPEVFALRYDRPVAMQADASRSEGGREPGLDVIGAPFMWNLGYTGLGRRLYTVDTGVWPGHPALRKQWRGNYFPEEQCWVGFGFEHPADKPDAHGTHVTGTVLGLDPETADTIGVAFNASFMATDPIVEDLADVLPLEVILSAFQFALDPDGDPLTSDDVPDVICNSWGFGDTTIADLCTNPLIVGLYDALDAAGIAVEFSAGNEGPQPSTMGMPAYVVMDSLTIFSVGAVDGNSPSFPIASFSSRGPSECGETAQLQIKPEVCAPGVNVRSSVQQNGYALYSGTSMAGPHVAGAVLLLKEAFPFLSGRELLNALYQTAIDLGEQGEDNLYGRGIINLEAAFNFLSANHSPVPPNTEPFDVAIESISGPSLTCTGPRTFLVTIRNVGSVELNGGELSFGRVGTTGFTSISTDQTLLPGESMVLNAPINLNVTGRIELLAVFSPYIDIPERDLLNNRRIHTVQVRPTFSLPYAESFEFNSFSGNNWLLENPDYSRTWDTTSTRGLGESRFSGRMSFLSYNTGQQDFAYTPFISLPANLDSLLLRFDYAYRFRNNSLADTVELSLTTDCGDTWQRVFYRGGSQLGTFDTLWLNFRPIRAAHWDTFKQDILSQVGDAGEVAFRLRASSRSGSNFFIDNLFLYSNENPTATAFTKELLFDVFPNPTTGQVHVALQQAEPGAVLRVFSITGSLVHQVELGAQTGQTLGLDFLPSGLYTIQLSANNGVGSRRLVLTR